jgi:predicted permease
VLAGSRSGAGAPSRWRVLTQPVRTPVVLGCAVGLLLAGTGLRLPSLVLQPLQLLAALAVPAALVAFGLSLHGAPRPASGEGSGQVWLAVVLKTVVQPGLAYVLGRWGVGLTGVPLLAVTLTSALPTAQNVFVYATAYDQGIELARDVVLLTTVLSAPVLVGVAVALG